MWKFATLLICLSGYILAGPVGSKRNMPIMQQRYEDASLAETEPAANVDPNGMTVMSSLSLPSNATSIRADITDGFSCENKTYGYYADVDNDCQIFHVCLPVTYADGKENTFRWSFICPEETIFSQDSFTCMRPDDMTISCKESYQYYELNRNFGIVESAGDKENSNEAASATAEINENVPDAEEEPTQVIGQSKPVNIIRPLRRKPAISYNTQNRPTSYHPLRKMPQAQLQPQMVESPPTEIFEDASENNKPVEEQEIKAVVQKFPRRPVPVMSNSFNNKVQNTKTENAISTRTELFNQMRKRPTLFDKKPAEEVEEEKVEQPKIELEQHNFSPMASVMSISNSNTEMAEAEIEPSASNKVFVKPEEANKSPENAGEKHFQVLEAFEEIPAVISEVVESPSAYEEEINNEQNLPILNEKSNVADEPQITEEVQSAEEVKSVEEIHAPKQAHPSHEAADQLQAAVKTQAVEEIADKAQTTEEIQNIAESNIAETEIQTDEKSEEAETSHAAEKTQNVQEDQVPVETRIPEATQVIEEAKIAEESEAPEEIKTFEESQTVMKSQAAKETSTAEIIESAEEVQAAEEEIPEVYHSLQSSAKEIYNSEEVEKSLIAQAVEEMQAAKDTEAVTELEVAEKHQSAEVAQEEQAVPTNEELQPIEGTQVSQEIQNNEKSKEHGEHLSEVQTQQDEESTHAEEGLVVEEPEPVEHKIEEYRIMEEFASIEDSNPHEKNVEPEQVTATTDTDLVKSESVSSEEGANVPAVQTIEQMESEKPADDAELMQSTEEMSHPDAMMQEMYENMEMGKQSTGGFKPVDPVMAHEAEKLIVDFINTLRKNDFTNETPGMHREHQINEVFEKEHSYKNAEAEETEKVESNEDIQETADKFEEQDKDETQVELSENQADIKDYNNEELQGIPEVENSKHESDDMTEKLNEFNNLKSLEAISINNMKESEKSEESMAEVMNLPQEMYQIPVRVISTPVEEMPMEEEQSHETEIEPAEMTGNTEERVQEESHAMPMAGNKPLSIDDIIELVKVRLDHMPKHEMETPMQLEEVIGEAQEDTAIEEQLEEQMPVQVEEEHQAEETVMPIYKRIVQPVQVDVEVQAENLEQMLNEEQSEVPDSVTDVKEKTNRSYRSHSVSTPTKDSRKRRFIFKADSS